MNIKGFQGTSLLDFPGRVASLIFWGGCNLTCPFCHNPPLVLEPEVYPDYNVEALLADLESRQPFIDGVVISGGEPTLAPELPSFLAQVKALGLAVKLDTNGLAPKVIGSLLEQGLVDFLAVDLKTLPDRYPALHTGAVDVAQLFETVRLCRDAAVTVEYRTTCVPGWVDEETIRTWGAEIEGAAVWAIQQFHPEHALDKVCREREAYTPEQVRRIAEVASEYVAKVIVRGV